METWSARLSAAPLAKACMPNLFAYLDYRQYLKDYYEEKKAANPVFSYQAFANKAGFKTKSFLKMVITGKKNLSESSLQKVAAALKLDSKSIAYFEDLVAFNQAKSLRLRNQLLEKLLVHKVHGVGRIIQQAQYEFYSQWYHNTIRELLPHLDFKSDYEGLGKLLFPPISREDAKRSVELMTRLGLIRKGENGKYIQEDPIITTGDDVISLAVRHFHLENFLLGAKALESCPAPLRDLSCLVVRLSDGGFQLLKKEIRGFRKRLLELTESDTDFKRVYHISFQMYPTTQEIPS
jgi:uncharacterized protein (TIGR02147 family)